MNTRILAAFALMLFVIGCGKGSEPKLVSSMPRSTPEITAQPNNQSVIVGQTAAFSVTATGTAPLTYQWSKGSAAIAGATVASYTTPATVSGDNGATFSVTVTNDAGSVVSSAATLTVQAAASIPTITQQPANKTVTLGQTATFSVTATGTAPLTYQWSKGSAAIAGATAAGYTTPATVSGDNGATFSVKVTNGAGSVTSSAATLTVNPLAPTVTLSANPTSVASGGSSTLTWSSTNASSCTASGAWSGAQATSGSQSTGAIIAASTFTLSCTGSGGTAAASATVSLAGTTSFPISISANARYLQQANGTPFPILGRASWYVLSLPASAYQSYLADTVAKGFNAVELKLMTHDPGANNAPYDGDGVAPFIKRLDGGAWSGTLNYGNIAVEAPDFTTPNETYWSFVDAFIDYCASKGILVFGFPVYMGYAGGDQGWAAEMVANGQTRMQTFGAYLANRYKDRANIVWMMGGDLGTGSHLFTSGQAAAETGLLSGLKSVAGQASTQFSAEWDSPSNATDQSTFGSSMTLNGAYNFTGNVTAQGVSAYAHSPASPAFLLEEPYDETDSSGTGENGAASQPVARFPIRGMISTIGGYIAGNGYVWRFNPGYASHLNTPTQQEEAYWNGFIKALNWYQLVPDGQGGIGTLVTAGGGTQDGFDGVTAAATPAGDLLLAYVGPGHTGTITIDMTKLRGTVTARWWDPTTGIYTAIGAFPNTGTHAFTTPGNHTNGFGDWVLELDS